MDKRFHSGFTVLELSKLKKYETFSDELQPYFSRENLQKNFMDCDSFVLSIRTQNIVIDSKNLEGLFDFTNLDENHELFSNKNNTVLGNFRIETP